MPTYPHIDQYREELQRLLDFGGSDNESSIRRAFAVCLDSYCRGHKERLALVDELAYKGRVYPDGTVKDSLRMAGGTGRLRIRTTIWMRRFRISSIGGIRRTISSSRTRRGGAGAERGCGACERICGSRGAAQADTAVPGL